MHEELIRRTLEAAILASSEPIAATRLAELFAPEEEVGAADIAAALQALKDDCVQRGIALTEVASGWRYQVAADIHPRLLRLQTERPSRYSRALLETLALIAYRQPITRGEIEQIRGVVVSTTIIRTLEEREWIRVVGQRDVPGRPALYGTTRQFLDYFNLRALDELPPLAAIRDLEEIAPQLDLDVGASAPATATTPLPRAADDDSMEPTA